MQTVIYSQQILPFIQNYFNLYQLYSDKEGLQNNISLYTFPNSFKSLLNTLEIGLQNSYTYQFNSVNKTEAIYNFSPFNKKIIIAFSGGKDSTALALHYKKLNYQVILYHLHGINKVYPNEKQIAKEVATYLKLPLIEDTIKLSGTNSYLEHPLKNQLICCCIINYLIQHEMFDYEIGFGDFNDDTVSRSLFDRNWSDSVEMWDSFRESLINCIGLKINIIFNNYLETLKIISKDLNLLNLIQSCLSPYRFLNNLHKINENKYNIQLFNHRCGSCWKCCVEYIYLTDNHIIEKNIDYYKHCLNILKNKYKTELPNMPHTNNINDIYKAFLLSDMPQKEKL